MKLRLSRYACLVPLAEGDAILWHSLSGLFTRLERADALALEAEAPERMSLSLIDRLASAGVLVPEGWNEDFWLAMPAPPSLERCRILTTTACNARCDYCYEKDVPVLTMDGATAEQTARFLLSRFALAPRDSARPIRIEWFGGEPLLNVDAISRISRRIAGAGIRLRSSLVTNGLLLDARLISRAREDWGLVSVQITLDGVGAVHESVKHLPSGSYEHLIACIRLLLASQIRVQLRINHRSARLSEEEALIADLGARFSPPGEGLRVYLSPAYAPGKAYPAAVMEEILRLNRHLIGLGLARAEELYQPPRRACGCFACSPGGYTIAPDGALYNCSHCMQPDQRVGSVWEFGDCPARDAFVPSRPPDDCISCVLLPVCMGGCRAAALGLAPMTQCFPYQSVLPQFLKERLRKGGSP